MKYVAVVAMLFTAVLSFKSQACQPGDRSKTLLVLAEAYGQENAVIAEVNNQGHASILRDGYVVSSESATTVQIKDMTSDHVYKFILSEAKFRGSFCYPVVLVH